MLFEGWERVCSQGDLVFDTLIFWISCYHLVVPLLVFSLHTLVIHRLCNDSLLIMILPAFDVYLCLSHNSTDKIRLIGPRDQTTWVIPPRISKRLAVASSRTCVTCLRDNTMHSDWQAGEPHRRPNSTFILPTSHLNH